jgi:hypothetical protein
MVVVFVLNTWLTPVPAKTLKKTPLTSSTTPPSYHPGENKQAPTDITRRPLGQRGVFEFALIRVALKFLSGFRMAGVIQEFNDAITRRQNRKKII